MQTIVVTDQMQRSVTVPLMPQRIVSLVPSQTELLFDLGLDERVVGITKFCIRPSEWFSSKTRVGGTKQVKNDVIAQLQPDLIIGNKEENTQADIEELAKHYPVWMSDIYTLNDALQMIEMLGNITQTQTKATEIISSISSGFNQLQPIKNTPTVLYLIWRKPYMAAGGNTFISNMLNRLGLTNVLKALPILRHAQYDGGDVTLSDVEARYPELLPQHIQELNPDYIFLSSEPYPFKQQHIDELQSLCPESKILLVDGEMFSWYGSRLKYAPHYFKALGARF